MSFAIDCRDLVVRYGPLVAVDRLSLRAEHGKVLALLGPNGAGKTSTLETLEGYKRPASGTVRVLERDPVKEHGATVARMGVMLQRGGVYPTMGPRRVLRLFASYYEKAEDVETLLELVGLGSVATTPWRRLSGGEQQRLSLALALVGRPEVLFLDEPTAGIDPEGRIAVRDVIASQRERGVCILLTTHELPEAERLADGVVIIAAGRAVASGTVAELSERAGHGGIRFAAPSGIETATLAVSLEVEAGAVVEDTGGRYAVTAPATPARLAALAGWLAERDLPLQDLSAGQHSLEDVYLAVTRSASGAVDGAERDLTEPAKPEPAPSPAPSLGPSHRREGAGIRAKRVVAQARAEVEMTLRRGESLLLTIGIPVMLLVFFSEVHLLPLGTSHPVSFLAPGILALAVMGTALVNLSIATGFERGYGVLKRLGSTPLGRPSLIGAKIASVLLVEVLQAVVLVPVAFGLGWSPSAGGAGVAVGVVVLATSAFAGIGLLLAGLLRAEVNLAAANGLWLILLLVSGMLAPLSKLPGWLEAIAKALPAAALAQGLHQSLALNAGVPRWAWIVLACWAVGAPAAAALTFRWE